MTRASLLFKSLRPHQWVKNGFVLMPLLFAQKVFHFPSLLKSLIAFAIFCLLAGAIYLINDLIDLEADRTHPAKKDRPASGRDDHAASCQGGGRDFSSLIVGIGVLLSAEFFLVVVIYVAVQALYNYRLKDVVILDLFCISSGFFLRMIGGAVAIQVIISHWLIICTVLISIFLALAKRRHELVLLGVGSAINHRKVLSEYDPYLLEQN